MSVPIFPAADGTEPDPYDRIAAHMKCPVEQVWNAFEWLDIPEWTTREHVGLVKQTTHELNDAARYAKNLCAALRRLSPEEHRGLIQAGAVTVEQVEHLQAVLAGDAANLQEWFKGRDTAGGRNPAAYIVAEGTRRLFRRLRRRITFGQHPAGGPSTDFGRAVKYALGEFGVRADWRRPAMAATEKQNEIQGRMARCAVAKFKRERGNTN